MIKLTVTDCLVITYFVFIGSIVVYTILDRICSCIEHTKNSTLKTFIEYCEALGKNKK